MLRQRPAAHLVRQRHATQAAQHVQREIGVRGHRPGGDGATAVHQGLVAVPTSEEEIEFLGGSNNGTTIIRLAPVGARRMKKNPETIK